MKTLIGLPAVATLRRGGFRSIAVPVGCMIVMLAGAARDAWAYRLTDPLTLSEIARLQEGDDIVLKTRDGRTVDGTFQRTGSFRSTGYCERYDVFRGINSSRLGLPSLGDSVTLFSSQQDTQPKGKVGGFEEGVIVMEWNAETPLMPVRLSTFDTLVTMDGNTIATDSLINLMAEGEFPYMSAIWIKTDQGEEPHVIDELLSIKRGTESYVAQVVAGAVAVALIILLFESIDMDFGGGSIGGSMLPYGRP